MTALADALRAQARALLALADVAEQAPLPEPRDELVPLAGCGIELRTLRRLIRDGLIVPVRLGRRRFVRRSDLAGLANAPTTRPPAPSIATRAAQRGRA